MPSVERSRLERFHFRRRIAELLSSPDEPLHRQDGDDENHECPGELERRGRVSHPKPGAEDGRTERLDAEIFDDSIIVQHFHQDEADPADDGDT